MNAPPSRYPPNGLYVATGEELPVTTDRRRFRVVLPVMASLLAASGGLVVGLAVVLAFHVTTAPAAVGVALLPWVLGVCLVPAVVHWRHRSRPTTTSAVVCSLVTGVSSLLVLAVLSSQLV